MAEKIRTLSLSYILLVLNKKKSVYYGILLLSYDINQRISLEKLVGAC